MRWPALLLAEEEKVNRKLRSVGRFAQLTSDGSESLSELRGRATLEQLGDWFL
jgi:hypothetical protein